MTTYSKKTKRNTSKIDEGAFTVSDERKLSTHNRSCDLNSKEERTKSSKWISFINPMNTSKRIDSFRSQKKDIIY